MTCTRFSLNSRNRSASWALPQNPHKSSTSGASWRTSVPQTPFICPPPCPISKHATATTITTTNTSTTIIIIRRRRRPEKYLYTLLRRRRNIYIGPASPEKYLYTSPAPEKPEKTEKPEKYLYTPNVSELSDELCFTCDPILVTTCICLVALLSFMVYHSD